MKISFGQPTLMLLVDPSRQWLCVVGVLKRRLKFRLWPLNLCNIFELNDCESNLQSWVGFWPLIDAILLNGPLAQEPFG